METWHTSRLVAVLCAVSLALAGCGSGGERGRAATSAPATSTEPAPTTTSSTEAVPQFATDAEGFTVIDASTTFGSSCRAAGTVIAAVSSSQLVVRCAGGDETTTYAGVDLKKPGSAWTKSLAVTGDAFVFNGEGGLAAFAEASTRPASGFGTESRELAVRAVSLVNGTDRFRLVLPRPSSGTVREMDLSLTTLAVKAVAHDGTVIVEVQWPMTDGPNKPTTYAIKSDGTVLWQQEGFRTVGDVGRDFMIVQGPNVPSDVISIATGTSAVPGSTPGFGAEGTGIYNDKCSDVFALSSQKPRSITVLNAKTGASFTSSDPAILSPSAASAVTMTPTGALFDEGRGTFDTLFIRPDGIAWRIGPKLAKSPKVQLGRLFMENQSGELLEVDQSSGKPEAGPAEFPPVGVAIEGGLLVTGASEAPSMRIKYIPTRILCR